MDGPDKERTDSLSEKPHLYYDVQSQKAVTAYFSGVQLLSFGLSSVANVIILLCQDKGQ